MKPEAQARQQIDALLTQAGWVVQEVDRFNLGAARGVAIAEFPLSTGPTDYLLVMDRQAVGVVEAKKVGETLTGVEIQSAKYREGHPGALPAARPPLPFAYETTGVETRFTNGLDPDPRSRPVFAFHRPETLAEWLAQAPAASENQLMRACLQRLPALLPTGLRDCQFEAITHLEQSLQQNRPRALVQMATGSGKTYMVVSSVYRLIKFGGARRVLFLVDRANLGRQTLKEFEQYVTPDDGRKFTELSRPRVSPIHSPARTSSTKCSSLPGAPAARRRLDCCARLRTRTCPSRPSGNPPASARAGQATSPSRTS